MTPDTIYWEVHESNVAASDAISTAVYTYTDKHQAENKLYRLWAYGAQPDQGETRQLLSAFMTEHRGKQIILLESKVFDFRVYPEPEPEPEPEPKE